MNVTIRPSLLYGDVTAPPAKSYGHRYLLASFLAGTPVVLRGLGNSADIAATIGALCDMGMVCTRVDGGLRVVETSPHGGTLDCAESGSTLRFLLPVVAALGLPCRLTGTRGLLSRPMGGLVQALYNHGACVEGLRSDGTAPDGLSVSGRLQGGAYTVRADVSSQYISGLLFALPLLCRDSLLQLVGPTVSRPYIDITLAVLAQFGIEVQPVPQGYFVRGGQTYKAPDAVTVPGDWSGAAFWLAAGAIGGQVRVHGLVDKVQGDSAIVDYLRAFGARVEEADGCVQVGGAPLVGTAIDIDATPDLAQILAVVAAYAQGTTVLKNVQRLRYKESDRLQAIMAMLQAAGIRCRLQDHLYIDGGVAHGGAFAGGNDHRTVMSSAILAMRALGNSSISDAQAVAKSYPDFFQDFRALGGLWYGDI